MEAEKARLEKLKEQNGTDLLEGQTGAWSGWKNVVFSTLKIRVVTQGIFRKLFGLWWVFSLNLTGRFI